MTDYKWEIKECAEQKEIFMMYLRERGRRGNQSAQEEPLRQFHLKLNKVRCASRSHEFFV